MLKKRLIFTLLYCEGYFVLSRNFNLQKIGNYQWLIKNYNFSDIYKFIDELIVLNISRDKSLKIFNEYCDILKNISKKCFFPISGGGCVESFDMAKKIFNSGCEKIVLNTNFIENLNLVKKVKSNYGKQSIICSIDYKNEKKKYNIFHFNGEKKYHKSFEEYIKKISKFGVGEIMVNSIDRDGTGNGFDLNVLNFVPKNFQTPIIFSGGAGHGSHFIDALEDSRVNAVSTANLLNFIGNGLEISRKKVEKKIKLPIWL